MADLFNIGLAGLRAHQAALAVTGQNITNANTPGYSRQRVEMEPLVAGSQGGTFMGSGVNVERIGRLTDAFATNQVRMDTALHADLDTFTTQIQQIEGVLLNDDSGLDGALQSFFGALQLASNDPSDTANRQMVLSEADKLSTRFKTLNSRLNEQQDSVTNIVRTAMVRTNELTAGIAELNDRIAGLQSGEDSSGALNGMLDRRDEMLRELSTYVNVTVSEQPGGQVNVFVGKGQALVLGDKASGLALTAQGQVALQLEGGAEPMIITSAIGGGEIGGALRFRDQVLEPAANQLGRIALAVAARVNEVHANGIDLNGDRGGNVFADLNLPEWARLRTVADEGNTGRPGVVSVTIDDPLQIPVSDYELVFDPASEGNFFVRRESDGVIVSQGRLSGELPQTIEFDHMSLTLETGDFAPGDVYHVEPLRTAAGAMERVLDDPALLALAGPVRAAAGEGNQGSGIVHSGEVFDFDHPVFGDDGALPPLVVRFTSETSYEILDNSDPTDPRPLDPPLSNLPYAPGQSNSLLPAAGTSLVRFEGVESGRLPAAGTVTTVLGGTGNGYSAQTVSMTQRDPVTGAVLRQQSVDVAAGSSAREVAAQVSSLAGVSARAETEVMLTDLIDDGGGTALAIAINGVDVGNVSTLNELADAVNANLELGAAGIEAFSDGDTLRLRARNGDDLTVQISGDATDSVTLDDVTGGTLILNGAGAGDYRTATIGGVVSAWLERDVELSSPTSALMDSNPTHHRADLGFELHLTGRPVAGDTFTAEHNASGIGDNRNGLNLAGLLSEPLLGDPPRSFTDAYADLVQFVGVQSSQGQINRDAAGALLAQSTARRESVSGVNLDEEAANLIKFEQAYNASAQIISVAREIFNTLMGAVR